METSKLIFKLIKFFFFNVILPLFDIGTDVQVFILYLFFDKHPNWAFLTLFWIFNPFLVHLGTFAYILFFDTKNAAWSNLFLHIPFVIPLKNCYRAYQLGFELDFGLGHDGKDWAKAEEILQEVAKASQWESFYEAGPQASQQLMIGFSTGRFRPSIVFAIIVSLLSLSWGASRTYFMERSKDKADPDPDVFMVGLRVFPWMVLMVLNSLVQWVLLGGLLGPWVSLVIAINFLCNYTTVKCLYKKKNCEAIVKQCIVEGK